MKTQREVTVVKLSDVIHFTESEKTIQINDMNQTVKIYMDENYAFDNEEICIDYDEKYVRVKEYDYDTYTITPLNPGVTKLELKVNGKSVGTMILTIENIPEYSDENYFDDDYYW